jgi:hypothetical protein
MTELINSSHLALDCAISDARTIIFWEYGMGKSEDRISRQVRVEEIQFKVVQNISVFQKIFCIYPIFLYIIACFIFE